MAAFASAASNRLGDPLLPQLARDFSISMGEAARAVSVFAIAYGALQLFYGPVGERIGKFRLIAWAAMASAGGALLSTLAPSFPVLLLGRLFTGATAAALIPMSMAWIADRVPFEERQPVLARFLTGQVIGVISGQALGGILADLGGWRSAFGLLFAIYAGTGLLLLRALARHPGVGDPGGASPSRHAYGVQLRSILARPWARLVLLVVLVEGGAVFGALAFLPSYLHQRFDLPLSLAGSGVAMFGLGGYVYIRLSRILVRRLGEAPLARLGGWSLALALALVAGSGSAVPVICAGALLGFGYYALHNTLQNNATQMAGEMRSVGVSLFAGCFFLGQSLGVGLVSLAVDRVGYPGVFAGCALVLPLLAHFFAARLRTRPSQA